jgi:hypothetical protein
VRGVSGACGFFYRATLTFFGAGPERVRQPGAFCPETRFSGHLKIGERLALSAGTMTRKRHDARPGALPEIHSAASGVTFRLEVLGVRNTPNLVLRCDTDGNVWASIEPSRERPSSRE